MKKIYVWFCLAVLTFMFSVPQHAFALAKRPSKGENNEAVTSPQKPLPPPLARDMQVSTGEIPAINQDGND